MKILVTGGRGLLGSEFGPAAARGAGGAGASVVALGHDSLDVTDPESARAVVGEHRPDWVVHCAAYTAVDRAEDEPDEAMRVNQGGTVNVAAAAAEVGARLVYVSTDYVFRGDAARPYRPDDPVDPRSVYARTKRAGEEAALASGGVVVRTGWLYGRGGRNFVDAIVGRAGSGAPLRVVEDQRGRPSWARNVAEGVLGLLATDAEAPLHGTWHVADGGEATWLEFAREVLRLRGLDVEISGVSTEDWGAAAPRPAYSVLDLTATEERLGRPMMHWKDAVARYLAGEGPTDSSRSNVEYRGDP